MLVVADDLVGGSWVEDGELGDLVGQPFEALGDAVCLSSPLLPGETFAQRDEDRLGEALAGGRGEASGQPVCFVALDAERHAPILEPQDEF